MSNIFSLVTTSLNEMRYVHNSSSHWNIPESGVLALNINEQQHLLDEHILHKLNELKRSSRQQEQQFDTICLAGFCGDDIELSPRVATALLDFFRQHTTQHWKRLVLVRCRVNSQLCSVLQQIQRLFPQVEVKDPIGSEDWGAQQLLSSLCRGNSTLEHLILGPSTAPRVMALDASAAVELNHILIDKHNNNNNNGSCLKCLELHRVALSPECVAVLAQGLQCNHSLLTLVLHNLNPTPFPRVFPDALVKALAGHPTLQTLSLEYCCLSQASLEALHEVLRHDSCHINSLSFKACWTTESRVFRLGEPGILEPRLVVEVIKDAHSLECLSLELSQLGTEGLAEFLDSVVDSCPRLGDINLRFCGIEEPFWKNAPKSRYRRQLQRLNLAGNPLLEQNRKRSISAFDDDMKELLRQYPALGEIVTTDYYSVGAFSLSTNRLLAFNYVGRGRLDSKSVPPSLWPQLLGRVERATANSYFLLSQSAWLSSQLHTSCFASVLFNLLREHPMLVTKEACRRRSRRRNRK